MKQIFTLLLLVMLFNTGYSQVPFCLTSGPGNCIPVGNPAQRGFYPPTSQWPPIVNGVASEGVVGFKNWDTVNYQGTVLTIDSMEVNLLMNLPNGLCYSTGFTTNRWGSGQYGCIKLSGTACAPPGQYLLNIGVEIYTSSGAAIMNIGQDSIFCFIRIVNPGETAPPVDTTQRVPFVPYGPSSPCGATSTWISPNVYDTVCANSTVVLAPVISGDSLLFNNFFTYQWITTGDTLSCTTCLTPHATITQNSQFVLAVTDIMGSVALDTFTYTLNGSTNNIGATFTNNSLACSNSVDTSTITINGGTAPYSINWGDGSYTQSGLGASTGYSYGHTGTFQVIITDANNCVSSVYDTIKLNSPIAVSLNITAQPTCAAPTAGAITALASGGTPAYSYSWSTGNASSAVSSLTTGNYTVTVTDGLYCTASASAYLAPVSTLYGYYVFLNETDANCGNTGSIQPYVFGGTAPYSYTWSNGASSQNVTGLAQGNYSVTVTDQGSCTTTGSTYINAVCVGTISGHVFSDNAGNCVPDSTLPGIANAYVSATSLSTQNVYYAVTDTTGFYTINAYDTGAYIIRAISSGSFFCNLNACTDSAVTSVASAATSNYNNLAMAPPVAGFDLSIYPTWTAGNPGFTKQYAIYYENNSLTAYTGQAAVTFVYDSGLVYQYSSGPQPIVDITNHTLTWALNGVSLSPSQVLTSYFAVPVTMSAGYVLQGSISISPTAGDCDTANNHFAISDIVTGSFDPNEKDVSPANTLGSEDSVLTYTIHFQNTGTDSTHFIIVKDTLSANLNPLTVHTIASSSRNCKLSITGNGILTFTFNPYFLCDSATNPGGSKGFVSFTVNKKQGIPYGAVISNTASVYFDYNAPVITNTVRDTFTSPSTTGITPVSSSLNKVTVSAYPVPFNDETNIVVSGLNHAYNFELYDLTGRLLQNIPAINTSQFVLRRNGMAAGVYMYRILSATMPGAGLSQVAVGRLVVE